MRELEVNRVQSPHSFVEETEVQMGAELCSFLIGLLWASALMTLHLHMDHANKAQPQTGPTQTAVSCGPPSLEEGKYRSLVRSCYKPFLTCFLS